MTITYSIHKSSEANCLKYMYSGTSLLWAPLGQLNMSRLARYPNFKDCFVHFSMIVAGTLDSFPIKEVSSFLGFHYKSSPKSLHVVKIERLLVGATNYSTGSATEYL